MSKVSIILPNYNHSKYLSSRIESILGQRYDDIELIILDDASTDNSKEIIEKYLDDPKVSVYLQNEINSGTTFSQWRKGIEQATGEYIWIAESDDIADLDFLSTMVSVLESNKGIEIAFCPSTWIDEKDAIIHTPDHEKDGDTWSGNSLIVNELLVGNLIYNASSAVFKKSLVSKVDFDATCTYRYSGDWFFWVQVIKDSKVNRVSKRLNFFRRHKENVSFQAEKDGLQFEEGLKIVKYIFKNADVPLLKQRATYFYWARRFVSTPLKNSKKVLKKLPFEFRLYTKILSFIS